MAVKFVRTGYREHARGVPRDLERRGQAEQPAQGPNIYLRLLWVSAALSIFIALLVDQYAQGYFDPPESRQSARARVIEKVQGDATGLDNPYWLRLVLKGPDGEANEIHAPVEKSAWQQTQPGEELAIEYAHDEETGAISLFRLQRLKAPASLDATGQGD